MDTTKNRKLLVGGAAAAFVLGAGAVAGAAVGAGPFETDDTLTDATATTPDSAPSGGVDGARTESTTFVDIPVGGSQTLAAGAAGFVTVTRDINGALRVVSVAPAAGWVFEVEPGDEIGEAEVDFRNGVSRVQFNAELEDGAVRVRVRTRGAAVPTTGGTLPDGTLPRTDNSGPGSLNSGPGSIDDGDNSGPGSGGITPGTTPGTLDDHGGGGGNSGPGGGGDDDGGGDDHGGGGGNSGPG